MTKNRLFVLGKIFTLFIASISANVNKKLFHSPLKIKTLMHILNMDKDSTAKDKTRIDKDKLASLIKELQKRHANARFVLMVRNANEIDILDLNNQDHVSTMVSIMSLDECTCLYFFDSASKLINLNPEDEIITDLLQSGIQLKIATFVHENGALVLPETILFTKNKVGLAGLGCIKIKESHLMTETKEAMDQAKTKMFGSHVDNQIHIEKMKVVLHSKDKKCFKMTFIGGYKLKEALYKPFVRNCEACGGHKQKCAISFDHDGNLKIQTMDVKQPKKHKA